MFRESCIWPNSLLCGSEIVEMFDIPDVLDENMHTSEAYSYSKSEYFADNGLTDVDFRGFSYSEPEAIPKHLMDLVSPNEILSMELAEENVPVNDPFILPQSGNEILQMVSLDEYETWGAHRSSDISPAGLPFDQMNEYGLEHLSDTFLNEIVNDCNNDFDIGGFLGGGFVPSLKIKEPSTVEEEILPIFKIKEEPLDNIIESIIKEENTREVTRVKVKEQPLPRIEDLNIQESITYQKAYHFDNDHCYSKSIEDCKTSESEKNYPFLDSLDSACSSSEEVDVVTVTEELHPPVMPKGRAAYRNQRARQAPKTKKQNSLNPRTLNAAMKRNITRTATNRRTYNRRKINNSVETTPSNSLPSSANSSRCSSDVEDVGKRANHNSSERKRREVLRNCLQMLRENVPAIKHNNKAAKVTILTEAALYVSELQRHNSSLLNKVGKEKNKNNTMRFKLKKLQAYFRSFKFMAEKQIYSKL